MNENPYHLFIDLITLDQEIRALLASMQTIDASIAQLHKQLTEQEAIAQKAASESFIAKKNVDEQELELKILDQKIQEKKRRLETSSGHKEYVSLEKEIK